MLREGGGEMLGEGEMLREGGGEMLGEGEMLRGGRGKDVGGKACLLLLHLCTLQYPMSDNTCLTQPCCNVSYQFPSWSHCSPLGYHGSPLGYHGSPLGYHVLLVVTYCGNFHCKQT